MSYLRRKIQHFRRNIWRELLGQLRDRPFIAALLVLLAVLSITSIVFRISEHDDDQPFWRSVVYVMSGLDVAPPETFVGQLAAAIVLVCGVVFASLLTGYLASVFSQALLSSQTVPKKPFKQVLEDHVILLGWGTKTRAILHELNADYDVHSLTHDDFVIVSPEKQLPRGHDNIYRNVWHVQGSPNETEMLVEADLTPHRGNGAKVAAVITDSTLSSREADKASLLSVLAVEHLFPDVVSLAEIRRRENTAHFQNAYVDEVITPEHYSSLLIARASEFPGVASYVDELLSLAPSEHEQSGSKQPPISLNLRTAEKLGVSGMTLAEAITHNCDNAAGIIAGLVAEDEILLFPDLQQNKDRKLVDNDSLIVIATPEQLK